MKKVLLAASAVALTVGGLTPLRFSAASADPASAATAQGYGANANLGGTPLINKAGLATATLPPGGDAGPNQLLLLPVAPIAISGTGVGTANAHVPSDLLSRLTVTTEAVAGPYNARAVGLTEGLGVLVGTGALGIPLVSAAAVRGEAVGVCRNGRAEYSANSEAVDLRIGGQPVGLNTPIQQLIDALDVLLQPLSFVADIKRNEVAVTATGAAVNALHVTVLGGIGVPNTTPVLDLTVGHAQVGGLACAPTTPQCADGVDNDGDGLIDAKDPGCQDSNGKYDPNKNDERNQCIDGIDNDGDGLIDFGKDPGCDSPQDNSELDNNGGGGGGGLARTGGESKAPLAGGLAFLALGALAIRRRSTAAR